MQQSASHVRHSLIESAIGLFTSLDSVRANHAVLSAAAGQVRPLLVHVHIPKCAGSSFNDLLRRTVGPEFHLDMYSTVPRSVIPVEALAEQLRAAPNVRSATSHSIRLFPSIIAGRAPLYVAFLRDPREWYVSNMTYLIKNYGALSPEHRANLPEACPEMSALELAEWLMDRNERENRPTSDVTDFLATPTFERHIAPQLPAGVAAVDSREYDAALLAIARHLLSRFFFVGVVERFGEGLPVLRERLAAYDIHLPADEGVPVVNTSNDIRGDLSWLVPDHPVGARALRMLRRDFVLYEYARRLSGPVTGVTGRATAESLAAASA